MYVGKNVELMDSFLKYYENKLLRFFFIYKIVYKICYDRVFDFFDFVILIIFLKIFF